MDSLRGELDYQRTLELTYRTCMERMQQHSEILDRRLKELGFTPPSMPDLGKNSTLSIDSSNSNTIPDLGKNSTLSNR